LSVSANGRLDGSVIEARKLTKKFSGLTAVDKLDLWVEPGETFGFLGPNGAGKTTTLAMLLGILKPTSGECFIDGQTVRTDSFQLKHRIGYVPEHENFYHEMTGGEYLEFFASLFQVENAQARINDLLDRIELLKWKNTLVEGYSAGMKKKLGIARAVLHSPKILILDEPVSNLDPFGIIQIRELLIAESSRGCTIFLSSHILSEVERIADRVGILLHGQLIAQDTMENIRSLVRAHRTIELELTDIPENLVEELMSLPYVEDIQRDGNVLTIATQMEKDYREQLSREIAKRQLVILQMRRFTTSLEDAFVTITEGNIQRLTDVE
jgi:ABC-2 type transport system ATP-binding protein